MTPMQAIRAKCLDCMCGQANEVKQCPCSDCPLYEYRTGHNPNRAGREMTPEQRAAAADRLRRARVSKNVQST